MLYVKRATIHLKGGQSFTVNRKDAQRTYEWRQQTDEKEDLILTDFDREVHPKIGGPISIPDHSVVYVAYVEDTAANKFYKEIQNKWQEIASLTGIEDDGEMEWKSDGNDTYIRNAYMRDYSLVSNDPRVAELVHEILAMEEQLDRYLNSEAGELYVEDH